MNELPLKDIHLPDPVSWWPPAPGWWILLTLLILLIYFSPRLIKKIKQKPLNKQAIIELKNIETNYKQQKDKTRLAQDVSALLRRICMSYLSRQQVASTLGNEWIEQVNSVSEKNIFSDELSDVLLKAPYQAGYDYQPEQLLNACHQWINALPRKVTT